MKSAHGRVETMPFKAVFRRVMVCFGVGGDHVDYWWRFGQLRLMNDHERGFLIFLAEPTKRRMKTLLELGERRRPDVRGLLHHSVRLNRRFSQHLTGNEAFSASAEAILRNRGAPSTCYVLSANSDLDGREMPLGDALEAIIGMGDGTFVSCIPGQLGFYEYEDMKSSYLLAR